MKKEYPLPSQSENIPYMNISDQNGQNLCPFLLRLKKLETTPFGAPHHDSCGPYKEVPPGTLCNVTAVRLKLIVELCSGSRHSTLHFMSHQRDKSQTIKEKIKTVSRGEFEKKLD